MLKGKGSLPSKCPNCKAEDSMWWENNIGESDSYDATCKDCGKKFYELWQAVSWEEA